MVRGVQRNTHRAFSGDGDADHLKTHATGGTWNGERGLLRAQFLRAREWRSERGTSRLAHVRTLGIDKAPVSSERNPLIETMATKARQQFRFPFTGKECRRNGDRSSSSTLL